MGRAHAMTKATENNQFFGGNLRPGTPFAGSLIVFERFLKEVLVGGGHNTRCKAKPELIRMVPH